MTGVPCSAWLLWSNNAGSHSPPEDRQARLAGAGRVNLRRRRITVISTSKKNGTLYGCRSFCSFNYERIRKGGPNEVSGGHFIRPWLFRRKEVLLPLPKNPRSSERGFFYPSRRLGISSPREVRCISSAPLGLYLITRQRAFPCGLMIYNASH